MKALLMVIFIALWVVACHDAPTSPLAPTMCISGTNSDVFPQVWKECK